MRTAGRLKEPGNKLMAGVVCALVSFGLRPGRLDEKTIQTLRHYENGLQAYRGREWDRAAACFEQALGIIPEDRPSRTMQLRCLNYKIHPPGGDWTGAYQMTTK